MSQKQKNRVASSKTTRGSHHPNITAGYAPIVQPAPEDAQPIITAEEVTRVLEVGRLLRSVLTPAELDGLHHILSAQNLKRGTDVQEELVSPMALDAEGSLAEY